MAATIVSLQLSIDRTDDFQTPNAARRSVLSRFANLVNGVQQGAAPSTQATLLTAGAKATGTITFTSSSGTVGATIGGTLVTVVWATSDTLSAAALAVAINANSTVNKWVTATSSAGVVTLTCLQAGFIGNNVTLVLSGTNVTVSGAKLTGGTGTITTYSL